MGFYKSDLAFIHDQGFGWLARAASEELLTELQPKLAAGERPRVVELGCGSGVLTQLLCNAGCEVTALDFSPHMLKLAREKAPHAQFAQGSVWDYTPQPCDAVCLVGEIVNYCAAGEPKPEDVENLLRRIHEALAPNGFLMFDSAGPGRAHPIAPKGYVDSEDWSVLLIEQEDAESRYLTRNHTTFVRDGELFRRGREDHRLRLWPVELLSSLLAETGFDVRQQSSYGNRKFPQGLTAFLASKR